MWENQAYQGKPILYINPKTRKDGKHKAVYVYPTSGRRFTKLVSQAVIEQEIKDEHYQIIHKYV